MNDESAIDRWMARFPPQTLEGLGLYRVFFASWRLLFGAPTVAWVAGHPAAFYDPPPLSLAALLSTFPPAWYLQFLDAATAVLLVCLLFGFRTKATSLAFCAIHLAGNHARYSFGKVDHDILVLLVPLLLAFSGWGERFSLDRALGSRRGKKPSERRAFPLWPVPSLAVCIAFGLFTAGFAKVFGWLDFDLSTSGARGWAVRGLYLNERHALLLPALVRYDNPWFWEVLDYTALLFEQAFLFCLPWPRVFRAFLGVACLFHMGNILMYNISFAILAGLYLLFIDWDSIARWLAQNRLTRNAFARVFSWSGLALGLSAYLPLYFWLRAADPTPHDIALLHLAPWGRGVPRLIFDALLLAGLALVFFWSAKARRKSETASALDPELSSSPSSL